MSYTQPAPPASSWEFRTQAKHAKPAPVAPVMPVETPKPAAPIVPLSDPSPITEADFAPLPPVEAIPVTDHQFLRQVQAKAREREKSVLTMAQEEEAEAVRKFRESIAERLARAKANQTRFFAGRPNISPLPNGDVYR
jgi:hypothetical protein